MAERHATVRGVHGLASMRLSRILSARELSRNRRSSLGLPPAYVGPPRCWHRTRRSREGPRRRAGSVAAHTHRARGTAAEARKGAALMMFRKAFQSTDRTCRARAGVG